MRWVEITIEWSEGVGTVDFWWGSEGRWRARLKSSVIPGSQVRGTPTPRTKTRPRGPRSGAPSVNNLSPEIWPPAGGGYAGRRLPSVACSYLAFRGSIRSAQP